MNKNEKPVLRDERGRWLTGSGSPSPGRPQSSRQRISERLLSDLAEVWEEHGKDALIKLAVSDPGKLATIAYGLLPRDVFVRVTDETTIGSLGADDRAALRSLLDVIEASKIEGDPQSVFERIERYLRSEVALQIDGSVSNRVSKAEHADDKTNSDQ